MFTHLHVHSEYSLLDGLARVPDLVDVAAELGFDALALTDHGVMYGAIQFYQHALRAGVKPIIGCELYVAQRSRSDRDPKQDSRSYHLTCLARNRTGYRNLVELVSRAQLEGFYYKPRVDRELLEKHADGLLVLSGCPSAEVPRQLREEQHEAAHEAMSWYREVFGEHYFVELQMHDIDFLPALNRSLLDLARRMDLPVVATNDVHYARAQDARAHEVLLCVQTGTTMTDPKRMRIGDSFYLRDEVEMRRLFAELPEAVDNTAMVAERCELNLDFDGYKLPVFDVPADETAATYLRRLCEQGVERRFDTVTPEVTDRLAYELGVINQMGFADYFLIVWDLCRFSRDHGIWWNVRGSGAGALVSYALGITNLDPLEHALIFERFLNPSRVSMPDIDLDFPDDQRDVVIRYAYEKYGQDRVAQIITFGTMGARAAIRDAGRALDMPLSEVDRVARLVPNISGKPCKLGDALRPPEDDDPNEFYTSELVDLMAEREDIANLVDTAQSLEGVARHASTHAAGVVIADAPLVEYIPLHRGTRSGDDGSIPVTQYAMNDVERLGLLKVDFLGLSTLTVLRRAAELIARYHGQRYTLDNIPLDDRGIYELLASGHVTGVFQVEGAGMRRMLKEMQPTAFEHVVAAIALYRPGPMDYIPTYIARLHGKEDVSYRHPALEPILQETYGIIVYQEQIIQIARDLAGYDAGEADTIRKAVGKKIKDKLVKHHDQFVDGTAANGIPRSTAEAIWADIETFARYGFNKAHAADYAVITCQTAFLKAHYPIEYITALLSVERNNTDKVGLITADAHRMGIKLLPPDVNYSDVDFTIEPLTDAQQAEDGVERRRGIRFGLAAVKNVGEGAVETILAARREIAPTPDGAAEAAGPPPFTELDELCRRVDVRQVGKRAMESLIRAGALDRFGGRNALLAVLDQILALSASHHDAAARGQLSLFGDEMPGAAPALLVLPDVSEQPEAQLQWEKDLIGLYLSDHPLHRLAESLGETVTVMIGDIDESLAGQRVTLAGLVTSVRSITTRKGQPMAFVRVEDLQGGIEITVFPGVYDGHRDLWVPDKIVVVDGTVEVRRDRLQVLADTVRALDPEPEEEEPDLTAAWGIANRRVDPTQAHAGQVESTQAESTQAESPPVESPQLESAEPVAPRAESAQPGSPRATTARPEAPPNGRGQPPTVPELGGEREAAAPAPASPALQPTGPGDTNGTPSRRPEPSETTAHRPSDGGSVPRRSTEYELTIVLPRSDDMDDDIQLLKQVHEVLSDFEGADRYRIHIPNGAGTVELEFPNATTRYCVNLTQRIERLVGAGRLSAQQL